MVTPILSALRAATTDAHRRLEALVSIEQRVREPQEYGRLLGALYGFYAPFESRLGALPWPQYRVDFAARRKTQLLREDLRALKIDFTALPLCEALPAVKDQSEGFGCLYVVEGSTLGGQSISRILETQGMPVHQRRFFMGYGADVPARWKETLAALDSFASGAGDFAPIVQGAVATFERLRDWLEVQLAPP